MQPPKNHEPSIYAAVENNLQDTLLSEKSKEQNKERNGKHLCKESGEFSHKS